MKYLLCFTIESDIFILRRVFYQFNVRNNILYIYIVTSLFYNPFFLASAIFYFEKKEDFIRTFKDYKRFF